ncbi:UAA transporter [Pseudovirgaria hyperparasitica]|uniref:UDP-galactose transporter homolog 1 n=1 Tax=Pseudovirgaria hyperparasitica TaxID=470096 RepID=A0A6A6W5Y9_9PEZI|nr:UAA transporter [Pseudovirgaria hyperparasitica]KAF2757965.1 UAA transporter [Pseudovirgaria hyperparasitica]
MARKKNPTPMRREPSDIFNRSDGAIDKHLGYRQVDNKENGHASGALTANHAAGAQKEAGLTELVFCVAGIYASFLTWAVLQERITTTRYGPPAAPETFTYSIFLNTVQSTLAALAGYIYLRLSSRSSPNSPPPIFPSRAIFPPLALVAITSSLASPFGYAALKHIDYITFILAKSCKLLPVMLLHLTVFRKSYPFYKYAVVAAVSAGVALFTIASPSAARKASSHSAAAALRPGNTTWGLLLLGVNLLFDGLTNSTQDYIFTAFRPYGGPQMMCAQNIMSTLLTGAYLLLSPLLLASSTHLGGIFSSSISSSSESELSAALAFIQRHPQVGWDVLGFAACGAFGQVFIFYTLAHFSSLLLVTVTVTRKMLTMVLSVVWFGHRIQGMQWAGVGLVFGGIGAEGLIQRREKAARARAKKVVEEQEELKKKAE